MSKEINDQDIFNSNVAMMAMKSMSVEDVKRYKQFGKEMFSNDFQKLDYPDSSDIPSTDEAVAYISESIKSGLHPSMLEQNEKELLNDSLGKEWYKKFGYVEGDLNDFLTIVQQ